MTARRAAQWLHSRHAQQERAPPLVRQWDWGCVVSWPSPKLVVTATPALKMGAFCATLRTVLAFLWPRCTCGRFSFLGRSSGWPLRVAALQFGGGSWFITAPPHALGGTVPPRTHGRQRGQD